MSLEAGTWAYNFLLLFHISSPWDQSGAISVPSSSAMHLMSQNTLQLCQRVSTAWSQYCSPQDSFLSPSQMMQVTSMDLFTVPGPALSFHMDSLASLWHR
jgi:hypothetical protein